MGRSRSPRGAVSAGLEWIPTVTTAFAHDARETSPAVRIRKPRALLVALRHDLFTKRVPARVRGAYRVSQKPTGCERLQIGAESGQSLRFVQGVHEDAPVAT